MARFLGAILVAGIVAGISVTLVTFQSRRITGTMSKSLRAMEVLDHDLEECVSRGSTLSGELREATKNLGECNQERERASAELDRILVDLKQIRRSSDVFCTPREKCVFDIGSHDGSAAKSYLADGLRVVAVEANVALTAATLASLANHVLNNQFTALPVAVSEGTGKKVKFYSHSNTRWGSLDPHLGCR